MPARISAWAVYDVFELAGGHQMFIAATGDAQWRTLCNTIGRNDLVKDPRLGSNTIAYWQETGFCRRLGKH